MKQGDERCHGADGNASGLFIRETGACYPGGKSGIDQGELLKTAAIFEFLPRDKVRMGKYVLAHCKLRRLSSCTAPDHNSRKLVTQDLRGLFEEQADIPRFLIKRIH
jgi:hypothetical protein